VANRPQKHPRWLFQPVVLLLRPYTPYPFLALCPAMYNHPIRRPSNVYHVRRSATDLNGMYRSPSGGYYGRESHALLSSPELIPQCLVAPEMSMVPPPLSPHFSQQPLAQPAMTLTGHRVLRRNHHRPYSASCCDPYCCERMCDECCENYCDRCCYEYCCCRRCWYCVHSTA
jgi:hypothetical protein